MAQPPQTSGYGLMTDSPDDYGLSKKYINESRLKTQRAQQEEAARKRRQEALDRHLSQFEDDPISKAVATIEFEKKEADDYKAAQKAAIEKEHEKIRAQYDDPISQAWAVMQYDDEQQRSLPAKQAFADQEAIEQLDKRDQTSNKLDRVGLGNAFIRESIGSAVNVVPELAAVPARAMEAVGLAEPGTADELHRQSNAFQDARQKSREGDMSPWLSRMYGGASQSLMQMGATPGGGYSKIIGSGVIAGSQGLTAAEDAGLSPTATLRYAGSQALFEAGVAAIGQKFLGAGIESRIAGQTVAAQTWKELGKHVGMDARREMPEEAVTAILQDVSNKLEGVSPNMQFGDFVTNATEAAVQAAMMAPMTNAPNAGRLAIEAFSKTPSRKNYDAAVKAGLPPIDNAGQLKARETYAQDLLKDPLGMRKPDPTLETSPNIPPETVPEPAPPATNPSTLPDNEDEQLLNRFETLFEKGEQDATQDETGQKPETSTQGQPVQGRQEGLLNETPAGTQDVATPAEPQDAARPETPDKTTESLRKSLNSPGVSSDVTRLGVLAQAQTAKTYDEAEAAFGDLTFADMQQFRLQPKDVLFHNYKLSDADKSRLQAKYETPVVVPAQSAKEAGPVSKPEPAAKQDREPWQMTRDEWADRKAEALVKDIQGDNKGGLDPSGLGYHYEHVRDAIAAGKPVPPEVLADYPDLKPAPSPEPPATKPPAAKPPVPTFAALPQKSQDLFNKAFESNDVDSLKQMVDKNNLAWNAEWESRTGNKLPRSKKSRHQAVLDWVGPRAKPEPAKDSTRPDLSRGPGQAGDVPGRQGVSFMLYARRPDVIPDTFKVVVSSTSIGGGGFLSVHGTGLNAEEAYDRALAEFDAKLKERTKTPKAKPEPSATEHDRIYKELQPLYRDPKHKAGDREHMERIRDLEQQVEFHKPAAVARAQAEIDAEAAKKPKPPKEPDPVETPAMAKGDQVSFKDRKSGKELTGIITSVDSETGEARIKVDQVATAGGVPVGRVEYRSVVDLKRIDQETKPKSEKPAEPEAIAPDKSQAEPSQADLMEAILREELGKTEAKPAKERKPRTPKPAKVLSEDDQKIAEIEADGGFKVVREDIERRIRRVAERVLANSNYAERMKGEKVIESQQQRLVELDRLEAITTAPPVTPEKKTRTEKAKKRTKDTAADLKAAEDDVFKAFGSTASTGLNAEQMRATARLVKAALNHKVSTFNEFVAYVINKFGEPMALRMAEGIELAWTALKRLDEYSGIDDAGKVADIISSRKAVTDEDVGTTETGTTDDPGREEDPGTGTGDSGDTQDTTGPADAEVLAGPPAKNGRKAKKTRNSSSVRGGFGGKVRSGSGEADSAGTDGSERSGTDSGGTSADDTRDGTGRDRAPDSTRPNYHMTNPDAIIGGGPKAKFERNRKAIEIARDVEDSNRTPTAEELDTLAGYMGWGAFGQELFQGSWENPRVQDGWADQDEWLRTYLGEEDWKSAQLSIVNAHFTDPQTVTATWDMLRRMGFDGGRVLEPSVGIGNFFSLMPRDLMERSSLTGIELDKMTAKIAKLLHPQANIQQKGYQESQTPDNFYDVIVSNVPFGNYKISDRRYKQDLSIHNYFFKRAFDQVKPGGVVAFLTSNMTMDGKAQAKLMRAQIAKDGDLVAAIRFPSGAFQAYAGTKVVADLIVIRKRKEGETPQGDQNWIDIAEMDTPAGQKISVNDYWQKHPQNILGTMTWGHGTTSRRPGMIVNQPTDLQASLDAAVQSMPENIINTERASTQGRERANTTAMRQNSVLAQDNELWIVKGEQLVPLIESVGWYRKGSKQATIDNNRKEIESLLDVRETMREVLDKQAASEDATDARAELNRTYDKFVADHGPIGKSAAAKHLRKAGDPMGNTLLALEKQTGLIFKKYEKRPIFYRSTVRQRKSVDSPTVNDAFAIERNRSLDLDMARIAEAAKLPVEEVIQKLVSEKQIYKTGNGTYDAADVFLSGNMARKLRQLQAAQAEGIEDLEPSIEAVRELMPVPVPYSQIEAKLGATWIEAKDYADMVGHLLNEPASSITVERRITGWKVTIPSNINSKTEARTIHGHPGIEFSKLMSAAMNNATVKITMPDPDGGDFRVTDPTATTEANAKISELRENFPNWLWANADRITRLSGVYNEEFNSTVTPKFTDVPLQFEGMAIEKGEKPFQLRKHQMAAIWRGIVSGKGIFAHEVGTGKTLTMAGLAMEARRLGLASKPILLAHNSNSLAVRNDIQEAYPGANILYVDNLDAATKGATLQAIATENWDLIVVPHSMAENFQLRPETVRALLKPEMDALEAAALEAFAESEASDFAKGTMPEDLDTMGKDELRALKEPTAKDLVKERLKLRAQIDKAVQVMDKGTGIFFEDMGVDMVMVDEAHLFKKLPITTKQTIKGLNKSASQMGTMMMMMTDYIRSKNNGRGVYMFTGTPITNTINEIFNMMRFVMAEEMEASNVRGWDGWFNNFATTELLTELSSGGTWENFDRLSSFVNLPELRQMVGQYMDIVFADAMEEFKPRDNRDGRSEDPVGRPFKQIHNVIIEMIDAQREHSAELAQRYTDFKNASGRDKVRMMREAGGLHNPLVIEGEGVKLAMDPRLTGFGTKLVDDALVTDTARLNPKDPNLKINKMISNAMTHYHEHPKSAQMVFMQVGYTDWAERTIGRTQAGDPIKQKFRVFNLAKEIKRRLIEEGVQESEIAIFSGMSKEKRTEAAELMKQGVIRFAIGSTETMGTGVNAQDELIAMHHLDAPWMPGDLEQRNGRGHRQGNKWNTVHEYRYLTEGPQDGRRWQVLLTKSKFIQEFMRGDSKARVIEMDDVDMSDDGSGTDMEQTFAAAAGDPRIMQRIRLEGQVSRLERLRDNHARTITETASQANSKLKGIERTQKTIDTLSSMHETWAANKTETPEITLRGEKYIGNQAITDQLQALAERYENKVHQRAEIGEYRGLPLFVDNGTLYVGNGTGYGTWSDPDNHFTVTARWNLQSLQGIMANIPDRVSRMQEGMAKDQRFIEMAQKAVGEPFPKQKQLDSKLTQLGRLQAEMTLNPTAAPAWLRAGAPIGTDVYWKGDKYEVTGHRMDHTTPFVLYSENDEFKAIPAANLTDAEGTRLFPDLEQIPEELPPTLDAPVAADLRQSDDTGRDAFFIQNQKKKNAGYYQDFRREWNRISRGDRLGMGPVITPELLRATGKIVVGEIRVGAKQFSVLIKKLRRAFDDTIVNHMKPTLIVMWNENQEKYGLDEASPERFDEAMSDTVDVDVEKTVEAAMKIEPASEVAEQDPLYSTKNEYTDAERPGLDMPKRTPPETQHREPSIAAAKEFGKTQAGSDFTDELISELRTTQRAATPYENDLVLYRRAELGRKLEAALRKKVAAQKAKDDVQTAVADTEAQALRLETQSLIDLISGSMSSSAGRNLQARKAVVDQDFSLVRQTLEFSAAHGREPNAKELADITAKVDALEAEVAALEAELAAAQAKNNDLETRLKEAHEAAVADVQTAPPVIPEPEPAPAAPASPAEKTRKEKTREKIENAYKRLTSMLKEGHAFSVGGALGESASVFIDLATGYSELGVLTLGDFLNRVGKRMGPAAKKLRPQLTAAWKQVRSTMTGPADISQITDKIDILDPDTIGRAARDLHRYVIERDGLDASPEGREAAVNAVHEILADFVPGITGDEVARAMSGIGIYSELSDNDIDIIRRDQKAQLLLLEQIADWKKGTPPPATGQERAPVSDEQRFLRRTVNEAKKESGVDHQTEGQLSSALSAAKRMAQNRIADLTKALSKDGKRIKRSKTVLQSDAELDALRAERDALQYLYDEVYGKNELTDEQRISRAEKMLDRAILGLEADLKKGVLYKDAKQRTPVTSPAIEAKKAALDALKASRDEMRLQSGEAQARSDAAFERHLLEREAKLAQRIADGDFKPKPKKPEREYTPSMLEKMLSIQKMQQQLMKDRKHWEFSQKHLVYRTFKKGPVAGAHIIRKALTMWDQSLIGRQGFLLGITHPIIYGKAISKAFASNMWNAKSLFPTEQDLFNTQSALDADAKWVRLEKIGKVAITDVHGGINREEGSQFVPEWFDKLPGVGSSERAGSAFINTQRRLVFRSLVEKLAKKYDGKVSAVSNAELRVIGNMVNIASGRGSLGAWANSLEAMTAIFFSPRWWMSRLQWWAGQPLWHDAGWTGGEGASWEVRQMAAVEWAKQAAAQLAIMSLAVAGLTAAFGKPGEDEEWDWYGNWKSPDFGRIRIGNSYIDMTAGLGQHLSLFARLFSGEQVDRWETKKVDALGVIGRHERGKLAPVPSAIVDYFAGQSISRDKFGSKEWLLGHVAPLITQDVYKSTKEEGVPLGPVLAAMMFFGAGAQTREARLKERDDVANNLRALTKQGKQQAKIQQILNDHLEHAASEEARSDIRTAAPKDQAGLQKVIDGKKSPELDAAIRKEKYDIILNASGRVSTDPKRLSDEKEFTGSDDKSRKTARELVKTIAPTVEQAIDLYEAAYRAKNKSLYEDGKIKKSVHAGRARIKSIYQNR